MRRSHFMGLALGLGMLLGTAPTSFAAFIPATPLPEAAHGSVWFIPEVVNPSCGTACLSVPMDSVPSTPADATFSTSIINFSSYGNSTNSGSQIAADYTIGSFLNSLGAVPLTQQTYSPFASALTGNVPTSATPLIGLCAPGFCTSNGPIWTPLYGTFIEITGDLLLTTGSHIKIAHDDGVMLKLNGVEVPGFSSPLAADDVEPFIYGGPSGLISFDLTYAESVEPPAFLQLAVPEPSSLAAFAAGLSGFMLFAWRRSHRAPSPAVRQATRSRS